MSVQDEAQETETETETHPLRMQAQWMMDHEGRAGKKNNRNTGMCRKQQQHNSFG